MSRLTVSRLCAEPTEPELPLRTGAEFTLRAGEVRLRSEPDDPDELFPATEREGKLRTREGEASTPDEGRMLRPDPTRLESTRPEETPPPVFRDKVAPDSTVRPDEEFDLRFGEDSRFPVEEKLRPTDLTPSRERACRAREATSPSALSTGLRLGWALPRERLPSCPTRVRSSATPDNLRCWS